MSTIDPGSAQASGASHTVTRGPWEPVGTGFRATGTPLQHPSILPWRPSSSPAGSLSWVYTSTRGHTAQHVDRSAPEFDGDTATCVLRVP
eukprot:6032415-Prymnesium_polylepis.1